MSTIEFLYEKNKKTIFSKAWEYTKKSNMDFEELVAEGNLIFCESTKKWKDSFNTTFNTYLTNNLTYRLPNYSKGGYLHYNDNKEKLRSNKNVPAKSYSYDQDYAYEIEQKEEPTFSLDDFIGDSKTMVKMILDNGIEDIKTLQSKMREIGWTYSRIWKTIKKMKIFIRKNERRK